MTEKSYDSDEIPKKLDYADLPKETEDMIAEGDSATIRKESKITIGKKGEYITRFPKEIVEGADIHPDDRVEYTLRLPKPRTDEKPKLTIELIKNGVQ